MSALRGLWNDLVNTATEVVDDVKKQVSKTYDAVKKEVTETFNAAGKPPTLKKGAKGKWVEYLQQLLGVEADGDFGNITLKALVAFQKQAKIQDPKFEVDGIAGDQTWLALGAGSPETPPDEPEFGEPTDEAPIDPPARVLVSIFIGPPEACLPMFDDERRKLIAWGVYEDGGPFEDLTSTVEWTSTDITVVNFDDRDPGVATAVNEGTAKLTASYDTVKASIITTVFLEETDDAPAEPEVSEGPENPEKPDDAPAEPEVPQRPEDPEKPDYGSQETFSDVYDAVAEAVEYVQERGLTRDEIVVAVAGLVVPVVAIPFLGAGIAVSPLGPTAAGVMVATSSARGMTVTERVEAFLHASGPSVVVDQASGVPQQLSGTVTGRAFKTFDEAFANKANADSHIAEVILNDTNGTELARWWEVSESLAERGIHGVGRAGDTEQKALTRVNLKPGQHLEIRGHYPSCEGCQSAMQDVAKKSEATITYRLNNGSVRVFPESDF